MQRLIFIFLIQLAACGSGGGSKNAVDRFDEFDDVFAQVSDLDVTPAVQFPDGGMVRYDGLVSLDLPRDGAPPAPYMADLTIMVDFAVDASGVSGSIGGFQALDGDRLSGTLVISDGTLTPDAAPAVDYQIRASVMGTLADGSSSYGIDGDIAGDFRGRGADAMSGVVFGDITGADGVDIFDGRFVAVAP